MQEAKPPTDMDEDEEEDAVGTETTGGESPSNSQPTASAAPDSEIVAESHAVPEDSCDENGVRPWDVGRGPRKTGYLGALSTALPAAIHVATGVFGSTVAGAGYAFGKAGEYLGMGKAVDSSMFQASFQFWLWSNGIFPQVQYDKWPRGTREALLAQIGESPAQTRVSEEDMRCTPILLSNHICYLDGLILAAIFGGPRVVAMAGTKNIPVIGKLMEEMDVVFVERNCKESRQAALDAIAKHCVSWKLGEKPMLVFPEGTTTNGDSVINFRKGAFQAGLPVRPVLIAYTGQWDPACTTYFETEAGRTEELSDEQWLWQFMGHLIHSLHVRVLPPYVPDDAEKSDPNVYAQRCHDYMAEKLKGVKEQLKRDSWQQAAGREDGGLGYKMFDETRMAYRQMGELKGCFGPRKSGSRTEPSFEDAAFEARLQEAASSPQAASSCSFAAGSSLSPEASTADAGNADSRSPTNFKQTPPQ